MAKEKDGTALRRLVITEEEKARVFEECHSAPFSGHAGRDNTLRKIEERFYWPDYYKNTMEMVSYKLYLFANHPVAPRRGGEGGTWVFFGWVCAARDSKLSPRSKKNFP